MVEEKISIEELKTRAKNLPDSWNENRYRLEELVVRDEPVSYQLHTLIYEALREGVMARVKCIGIEDKEEVIPDILQYVIESEPKLLEHTEKAEALIKKMTAHASD